MKERGRDYHRFFWVFFLLFSFPYILNCVYELLLGLLKDQFFILLIFLMSQKITHSQKKNAPNRLISASGRYVLLIVNKLRGSRGPIGYLMTVHCTSLLDSGQMTANTQVDVGLQSCPVFYFSPPLLGISPARNFL